MSDEHECLASNSTEIVFQLYKSLLLQRGKLGSISLALLAQSTAHAASSAQHENQVIQQNKIKINEKKDYLILILPKSVLALMERRSAASL